MAQDRLITVAIHTYERAVTLKTLLESEGVPAVLQNVNLVQPVVSSGVRVRIQEKDLPLALRIIENSEIFIKEAENNDSVNQEIVVPIDFSDYSILACRIAFHIASMHKANIKILHSYVNPYETMNLQLSNTLTYEPAESDARQVFEADAVRLMSDFKAKIKSMIKQAEIPPVKFHTAIFEGVPEDVITGYAKEHKPILIVMGTRGKCKKERELIGSVTAEVLDSCRFPAFTVPESAVSLTLDAIKNIYFFSNLDQEDMLAMDVLYRILPGISPQVTIINVPDRKQNKIAGDVAMENLLQYCQHHYPTYSFKIESLELGRILDDFKLLENRCPVNLIVVPNKKKNIFARLFNPSLAHKMLFHADIPMMVIPV